MHKFHVMAQLITTPPSVTQGQLEGTEITASAGAPPFWGPPHNSVVNEKIILNFQLRKI